MKKENLKFLNNGRTLVVSGFPGIGKSECVRLFRNEEKINDTINLYDSDSSEYSWIINENGEKVRNPEFPKNYMKRIIDISHIDDKKLNIVFVSTHKEVLDALIENEIPFLCVYPSKELKDVFMKRYKNRGSDESFINLMDKKFNSFVEDLDNRFIKVDNQLYTYYKCDTDEYLNQILIKLFIKL